MRWNREKTKEYIYAFLVYGFVGLLIDSTVRFFRYGDVINGTFFGFPWSPMYAVGAIGILFFHRFIQHLSFFWQFWIFGSALSFYEYTTGILTEYFFDRTLWDYSTIPLHIGTYTTFWHLLAWGALALFFVHYIHPTLFRFLQRK